VKTFLTSMACNGCQLSHAMNTSRASVVWQCKLVSAGNKLWIKVNKDQRRPTRLVAREWLWHAQLI